MKRLAPVEGDTPSVSATATQNGRAYEQLSVVLATPPVARPSSAVALAASSPNLVQCFTACPPRDTTPTNYAVLRNSQEIFQRRLRSVNANKGRRRRARCVAGARA